LGSLFALIFLSTPILANERPKEITWFRYDLPPYHILRGEYKGQGPLDYIHELEKQWLSDHQHKTINVNVTRMLREFSTPGARRCITSSFIFPASLEHWVWSHAMYVEPPAVIIANAKVVERHGNNYAVDFESLIKDETLKFGHFDKRIYSGKIDQLINEQIGKSHILPVASYAPGESLMRMLQRGRVDYIIEYLPEIHWLMLSDQQEDNISLSTLKIEGHDSLSPVHIGCAKSEWGEETIKRLNKEINANIRQKVWQKYERWLHSDFAISIFRDAQERYFNSNQNAKKE